MDTINQMCLAALPGYAPRGIKDRVGQAALSLAELDAALGAFIVEVYNHRVHSETGQPPQARWEAGGLLPRLPESLDQLDLLLLTVAKPRKIHPDGIRFQGLRYLDPILAAYVGETVIIRYDPRDLAEIRVFHRGRFLTRAICPDLAASTGPELPPDDADFIVTKEHRRFTEFAAAVRRDIGNQRYQNVLNDPLRETCAA
jgi:putative transposase